MIHSAAYRVSRTEHCLPNTLGHTPKSVRDAVEHIPLPRLLCQSSYSTLQICDSLAEISKEIHRRNYFQHLLVTVTLTYVMVLQLGHEDGS